MFIKVQHLHLLVFIGNSKNGWICGSNKIFEIFVHANDIIIQTMLYVTVILTMTIPNLIAFTTKRY